MSSAPENRTPSAIEIDDDSDRRRWESHESLGYKRASANSYSLAESPTPQDPLPLSDPPSAIAAVDENQAESSLPRVGDTSFVSSRFPDESMHGKVNTTRFLERALERDQLNARPRFSLMPPKTSHSKYVDHTATLHDPKAAYTQVLVWCLQRRIDSVQRSPPKDLTMSKYLEVVRVLKAMQSHLANASIKPRWQTHELIHLKPQMANPENTRSAEIASELNVCKRRLHDKIRQSWNMLKNMEVRALDEEAQGGGSASNGGFQTEYETAARAAYNEGVELIRNTLQQMTELDAQSAGAMSTVVETMGSRNQGFLASGNGAGD